MKKYFFLLMLHCLGSGSFALNITIIESTPHYDGVDKAWRDVVSAMGHVPTIRPQSILDDTAFFPGTDILIISNGLLKLSAFRMNTILEFIKSGRPVYQQSEYQAILPGNVNFKFYVTELGGSFNWGTTVDGDLTSMKAIGTYSTTNNAVSNLDYYWYSVWGEGDCNTIPILSYGGKYHGFQYVPMDPSYGSIITTSDQDWVHTRRCIPLMENIITHLIAPPEGNGINVDLGNDTSLCSGETLVLNVNIPGSTYLWQDNSVGGNYTVRQPGTYSIRVTKNGCQDFDTIVVSEKKNPEVNLGNDTILCRGNILELNTHSSEASHLWQDGSEDSLFTVNQDGIYWVKLTNRCGTTTDSVRVNYDPGPTVNLGIDTSLCKSETMRLKAGMPGATYLWQDLSTGPDLLINQSGIYWVEVSTPCGSGVDTIVIADRECSCFLFVPNAFTPGTDDLNDVFAPEFNCGFSSYRFVIFNRWGEKLFETDDPGKVWDGTYLGEQVPEGVYFFMLNYTFLYQVGPRKEFGNVTLLHSK